MCVLIFAGPVTGATDPTMLELRSPDGKLVLSFRLEGTDTAIFAFADIPLAPRRAYPAAFRLALAESFQACFVTPLAVRRRFPRFLVQREINNLPQ